MYRSCRNRSYRTRSFERGAIGIGAIGIKSCRKGVSEFEKDLMSEFDFKVPHDGRLDFLINS